MRHACLLIALLAVGAAAPALDAFARWDFDAEVSGYVVRAGRRGQVVGANPGDAGFLEGDTTCKVEDGWGVGLKFGIEGLFGNGDARAKVGLDARVNLMAAEFYRGGIYDVRQQSSDTRPAESGSFVYSLLKPSPVTVVPHAGVELRVKDDLWLDLEAGAPFMGWTLASGWDRYGKWHQAHHASWWGLGARGTVGLRWDLGDKTSLRVMVGYEGYRPEFHRQPAEVHGILGAIGMAIRF